MIVYCAGTPFGGIAGTDVHMAGQLSRHVPVLYVDPPVTVGAGRSWRIEATLEPELRQVSAGLHRLTPRALPGHTRRLVDRTTPPFVKSQIERAVRSLGMTVDAVVVSTLDDLLDVCDAPRRVFYGTDDYVAGAELMGLRRRTSLRSEARQLEKATEVVAVSSCLARRWSEGSRKAVVITNGCDAQAFAHTEHAPRPQDLRLTGPIAGLVGHISARTSMDVLEAVAASELSLLLVGPIDQRFLPERMRQLLARPNVQAVGAKRFAELPGYLNAMDVGLTPYADTAFNRASFPLKTLEYLAAGRPVVSSELPATRWLDTDLVVTAQDPASFVTAVEQAVGTARDEAMVTARRSFAARHSWASKAEALRAVLDGAVAP